MPRSCFRVNLSAVSFVALAGLAFAACETGGIRSLPDVSLVGDAGLPSDAAADASPDGAVGCTAEGMGATLGQPCASTSECDDSCFCNGAELCIEGVCTAGAAPCTDAIDCTTETCLEDSRECVFHADDAMCSDGDACNGAEVCDRVVGCRAAAPLYCNDEDSCTFDSCDLATGCVFSPRDLDGDGFTDGRCGGGDCDDDPRFGADIHPGATELCDNRRDDNCDGLRDYNDPTCLPTNDACDSAQLLPGSGTYSGSTAGLAANLTLSCRSSGPDAVYRFSLDAPHDVRVTVAGGGSGAAVAIRPVAECATGPDIRCGTGTPPRVLSRSLPAGDYAIIVQTSTGSVFDLNLNIEDPTPIPPVDLCNATTTDISAGGTFDGMFADVEGDYSLSCHTSSTNYLDAAYTFTLTAPQDVTLTASTSGAAWTPTTYLSLVTDCSDSTTTLSCISGTTSVLRRRALDPGTYYVLLESSATDATDWHLDAVITDPLPRAPADACTTVEDITFGPATASLDTAEFDVGTSCGGTGTAYRDLFFKFSLTTPQDVSLSTTGAGFHYAAIETSCGVTGTELRCRSGSSPLVQSWRSLPAGDYYAVVSTSLGAGTVTAEATFSPPTPIPPNDRCSGAIDVSAGYSATDTLVGFEDDVLGCSGSSRADAFYVLHLTESHEVVITAQRPDGTSGTTLSLRAGDCSATANLACGTATPAAIDRVLDAGTYTIVVEQPLTSTSDFALRVIIL